MKIDYWWKNLYDEKTEKDDDENDDEEIRLGNEGEPGKEEPNEENERSTSGDGDDEAGDDEAHESTEGTGGKERDENTRERDEKTKERSEKEEENEGEGKKGDGGKTEDEEKSKESNEKDEEKEDGKETAENDKKKKDEGETKDEENGRYEGEREESNANDDRETAKKGDDKRNGESEGENQEGNGDEDHGREVCGSRNANVTVKLEKARDNYLKTIFQRFLEKIAELETKYEVPGYERLSCRLLLKRSLTKAPLKQCYADRQKDTVVLLVDTSGSMEWWTDVLKKITTIALERRDVEIYEAPNGIVTRKLNWEKLSENYCWTSRKCLKHHEAFTKRTKNRVIVYVGDFDGGDTVYELAKNNVVYWICNENRYEDTSQHDWCHHALSEYPKTCKVLRILEERDFKKLRP